MTLNENRENNPWWETELPALKVELITYLRHHVPALRNDHDDLISDTLLSLTQHVRRNTSTLPQSWFKNNPPRSDEQSYLHKLAIVILKRRIADNFRKRVNLNIDSFKDTIYESSAIGQERRIILARILDVVRSALDEMSVEDRDLIALISHGAAPRDALNDRDRQRLHRLRKRLKERIALRLGADVSDLLKTAN